ncbi:MAG: hypothetical protein AAGF35_05275 [Pseudomonadota bacterium]
MRPFILAIATLSLAWGSAMTSADAPKDCLLEGTVQRSDSANTAQDVSVKFHSVGKYSDEANCRVRRGEKMEFKLPADPRLQNAEPGSPVQYRYQSDGTGNSSTELVSIGA